MFEGFPDGGDYYEPWNYENGEPPYVPPPKWWEVIIAVLGFVAIVGVIFRVFIYGF